MGPQQPLSASISQEVHSSPQGRSVVFGGLEAWDAQLLWQPELNADVLFFSPLGAQSAGSPNGVRLSLRTGK